MSATNIKSPYALTIQNVVCNCTTDASLNIVYIVEALHGRFDSQVFPACVSSCRQNNIKISIFSSGQVIIAGAKGYYQALEAAYLVIDRIRQDFGMHLKLYNFAVKNIVCSTGLGFNINLPLLNAVKGSVCSYEPESFAGLAYEITETDSKGVLWKVSAVVFSSGSVVVTGIKDPVQIRIITERLKIFKAFEKNNDFRSLTSEQKDEKYGIIWRKWGLIAPVIDPDLLQHKKQRKLQIKKQARQYLKLHIKDKQKKSENKIFKKIQEHRKITQETIKNVQAKSKQ